jgi:hypothetical protein
MLFSGSKDSKSGLATEEDLRNTKYGCNCIKMHGVVKLIYFMDRCSKLWLKSA